MKLFPHKDKLEAAIANPKAAQDVGILQEALAAYSSWIESMQSLQSTGDEFLRDLVSGLNSYKDYLEVELIARRGSDFLKRQKGQLKIDNSVIEEFLPYLVDSRLLNNLPTEYELETGSQTSFMSLSFCPTKLRKRSKLLRMNNDLLVEYVLGYELAIYRVFWSSAFCITSNNSFCIAKVLIFSHFTKNSQRKFPFYPHFG